MLMLVPATPATRASVRDLPSRLPRAPGVYRFRDERGRVLYLGRASDLRSRVRSYWGDLDDRPHLRRMVGQVRAVQAVLCDSVHEACWLERTLLQQSQPRWNRTPGGQEVEVYITLAPTGMIVTHDPAEGGGRRLGPYLGGVRVRTAVTALQRLIPLQHSGSGGGSGRALAAARGVPVASPEDMMVRLEAVLRRDPSAVTEIRAALARRRDGFSAALQFELAARAQADLEAVDWLLAEQKVALAEPVDADVYGWAGGILVRFDVRSGRVVRWGQRASDERSGRRLTARTPGGWLAFAQRAADLAMVLAAE